MARAVLLRKEAGFLAVDGQWGLKIAFLRKVRARGLRGRASVPPKNKIMIIIIIIITITIIIMIIK